jgi:hypothetical protein
MSLLKTRVADPHGEILLVGRRSFLGSIGMMAGAVMATSLVPLSTVHAVAQLPGPAASGETGETGEAAPPPAG